MLKKYLRCIDFTDIRLWLCLAFIIRLIGITNPPFDPPYNWREADVLTVARNFVEVDANILYPRVDSAGEKSGITGMEFPLLNYLIFLVSLVFGYDHWYGRLINLTISSLAIFFYHRILTKYIHPKVALYSSVLLIFSLWLSYSRKSLPDTLSTSLALIGMYYGLNYLKRHGYASFNLVAYMLFGCLGMLAKIPASLQYVVFLLPILSKQVRWKEKWIFSTASICILTPVIFWYFYWSPQLTLNYGYSYFFTGKDLELGARQILQNFFGEPASLIYVASTGYSGFIIFIFGLYQSLKNKQKILLLLMPLSFLSLLFFMLKSGANIHHDYYIIWWVPAMTLFAGYGINQIKSKKLVIILLAIVCLESIAYRQHHFRMRSPNDRLLGLEKIVDTFSTREQLFAINSANNPLPMYLAHRKGWLPSNKKLQQNEYLAELKAKGCRYIIILKRIIQGDLVLDLPQIVEDEDFRIYSLGPKK